MYGTTPPPPTSSSSKLSEVVKRVACQRLNDMGIKSNRGLDLQLYCFDLE